MSDTRRRRKSNQSCGSDDLSDSCEELNATKETQVSCYKGVFDFAFWRVEINSFILFFTISLPTSYCSSNFLLLIELDRKFNGRLD